TTRVVGPGIRCGRCEIVREVLGGPGIVGPVDRCDLQVRKVGVRVVRSDLRIVPTRDLLIEYLCDRVRAQVQRIHTVEVEHHRDRHRVGGQVDGRRTATPLQGVLGLVRVHRRVGTGKGHRIVDELVTATTRPDRVVVDACVLTPRLVTGDPGRHRILLGAGARPGQTSRETLQVCGNVGGRTVGNGVVTAAGGRGQPQTGQRGRGHAPAAASEAVVRTTAHCGREHDCFDPLRR